MYGIHQPNNCIGQPVDSCASFSNVLTPKRKVIIAII